MRYILYLLLALSFKLNAQERKFNLGLETGPSYTTLWGNSIIEQIHQPTYQFVSGLQFQYHVNWNFSLYGGLQYGRIGISSDIEFRNQNNVVLESSELKQNFDYLILPFTLRYHFGLKSQFFIEGGTYYGWLLNAEQVIRATETTPESRENIGEQFYPIDYGLTVGFGMHFPINKEFIISLCLRNNYGLYNLSIGPVVNDGSIRTNSSHLLVGLIYQFGPKI